MNLQENLHNWARKENQVKLIRGCEKKIRAKWRRGRHGKRMAGREETGKQKKSAKERRRNGPNRLRGLGDKYKVRQREGRKKEEGREGEQTKQE